MQPSGLCSELDCNLMLCDSQLGEVSIITGLQGGAEFLELLERCTDLLVSTRTTVLWYMYLCPLTSQYEANIKSVADYIKSSVDEVKGITGKNTTNGPMEPYLPRQPPLFKCFLMVSRSWIPTLNWWMEISVEIWKVAWLEPLHAAHHHKHEAGAHVTDYARGFGNTAKEGLKRTTRWAAHYFTNKKSYYPVPSNSISFWDIPFLPLLPTVQRDDEDQERMIEWVRNSGKSVPQRTVRQETTKYKTGTLLLNIYERKKPSGEKNTVCNPFCPWSRWNPFRRNLSKLCWTPQWKPGGWAKNKYENVKTLPREFFFIYTWNVIASIFAWTWKNFGAYTWRVKRPNILTWFNFPKGYRGPSKNLDSRARLFKKTRYKD